MLKKNLQLLSVALCCAALLLCTTGCSLFRKGSRARVNALLVSGNYAQPRLLCELAQYHTHQPVMVFNPADESGEAAFYYLSPDEKAEAVPPARFKEFVDYLKPRVIVFLGDNTIYPTEVISEEIRNDYRVMILGSNDWSKNAMMLGDLLGQGDRLYKEYLDYYGKLLNAPDKAAELPK